jgi:hypothetical protein
VVFPPGRAKLSTKPPPTGSTTDANTIGTVRVACCNAATAWLVVARMTSGASATNSAAYVRTRSTSPTPQRVTIRTLRPSVQPNSCSPCANAVTLAIDSGSSAAKFMSTPMIGSFAGCCARAASGHATVAPPIAAINSRRLIVTGVCSSYARAA